ncbi:YbeD family protein [Basilea psittacipulmonis]|uniref:UPF0250 protein IX83_00495 n=1 Tax=Basilea psittacipulmonis DSM 24701 TaxID=1072685 RepID=A0A077DBF7_9BURK|nr:DUF493 family protein [Basilea psittacipulmonis]AIL32004.1 hypothetical protein IX83_00495 [Basilea psittacipulmonis DSM 24701]
MTKDPKATLQQAQRLEESLIEYPCEFPIKAMGVNEPDFAQKIVDLVKQFDPDFDASTVVMKPSSGGKYLGLTLFVNATSREQLDNIYRALTSHELVKYVL